jgi:hypothetical protein
MSFASVLISSVLSSLRSIRPRAETTAAPLASAAEIAAARDRLEAIARALDSAIAIPGTRLRIGADAVLNLIPGVGVIVSKGIAAYLILEARRLGAPRRVLLRMAANLGVDTLIGLVPVLGWAADAIYRANDRNMELLRAHLARESAMRGGPVIDIVPGGGPASGARDSADAMR